MKIREGRADAIDILAVRIREAGVEKSRLWWERYMKGVIPFHGTGIPVIRSILAQWREDYHAGDFSVEDQFLLSLELMRRVFAEEKLAGVIYLQEYLLNDITFSEVEDDFAALFDEGHIFDWNVCDWFCVRVLGPLVEREGKAAEPLSSWRNVSNLWRARASLVGFVNLAGREEFVPPALSAAEVLIQRPERFAKTAVGWYLRERSRYAPRDVPVFLERFRDYLTREVERNATKYLTGAAKPPSQTPP